MKKISVIIPCYNSEKSLSSVVNSIRELSKGLFTIKIILVNDYSKDCTWKVIRDLCAEDKNIIGLSLSRNFGQQSARMAALPYVDGDYIVFMDDDGQHNPGNIIDLITKLDEGYDIVYAYFKQKKESFFRIIGSNFTRKMVDFIMGKPSNVHQSSFFVVKRYVIEELKKYHSPTPVLLGYFMQITKNIADVEIEHYQRIYGKSGYNLKKLIRLWMDLFTSFSVIPLRISSLFGCLFSFCGVILGIIFIIKKLIFHMAPAGYTSLVSIILFSSGIMMLMIGMLGEYIGRIFIALNEVPQYVIRDECNTEYAEKESNNVRRYTRN